LAATRNNLKQLDHNSAQYLEIVKRNVEEMKDLEAVLYRTPAQLVCANQCQAEPNVSWAHWAHSSADSDPVAGIRVRTSIERETIKERRRNLFQSQLKLKPATPVNSRRIRRRFPLLSTDMPTFLNAVTPALPRCE
jgi:hypothetical protein